MSFLVFLLLGLIQGATEFLPISSTGHLIVFESFFKVSPQVFGLLFDVSLHLGTLIAVIVYFANDLKKIFIGVLKSFYTFNIKNDEQKLGWMVLVSSVPAAIIGYLFSDIVETTFRSPMLVALMLFLVSLYFIFAESRAKHTRTISKLNFTDAFILGIAQAIALIPGTSRSGIVLSSGMILGLKRVDSARYTFLMSVPIIAGAAVRQLSPYIANPSTFPKDQQFPFVIGTLAAGISGFLAIKFMMKFLSKFSLITFVIYRYAFGGLIILLYLLGWIS